MKRILRISAMLLTLVIALNSVSVYASEVKEEKLNRILLKLDLEYDKVMKTALKEVAKLESISLSKKDMKAKMDSIKENKHSKLIEAGFKVASVKQGDLNKVKETLGINLENLKFTDEITEYEVAVFELKEENDMLSNLVSPFKAKAADVWYVNIVYISVGNDVGYGFVDDTIVYQDFGPYADMKTVSKILSSSVGVGAGFTTPWIWVPFTFISAEWTGIKNQACSKAIMESYCNWTEKRIYLKKDTSEEYLFCSSAKKALAGFEIEATSAYEVNPNEWRTKRTNSNKTETTKETTNYSNFSTLLSKAKNAYYTGVIYKEFTGNVTMSFKSTSVTFNEPFRN